MRSVVPCLTAGLIACPAPALPVDQASPYPSLNRAVASANAQLSSRGLTWRPLDRAEVLGRRFEAFRLGDRGPRFVWIPTDGDAVSVQTWVRHHRLGAAGTEPRLLDAGVIAVKAAAERDGRGLRVEVGRDQARLSLRTMASPARWSVHVAAHADWLCRPSWSDDQLRAGLDQAGPKRGWLEVAERLRHRAWRARHPGRATTAPAAAPTPDDLRLALMAWLRPSDAVIVVAGPVPRRAMLTESAVAYQGCAYDPDDAVDAGRARPGGRVWTRVPGAYRQVLMSWSLPRLTPRQSAALDGLAVVLTDRASPLHRALIPDHATGVAVRPQRHAAGASLELYMTLAPTTTASRAVTRTRRALRELLEDDPPAFGRAQAGLRSRLLRRLSALDGASALAAGALLNDRDLGELARWLEGHNEMSVATVQRFVADHLVARPPLVVVGRPRGRR